MTMSSLCEGDSVIEDSMDETLETAKLRPSKSQDGCRSSETKRYSEILRDFDASMSLSLACSTVDELLDSDSLSIADISADTTLNTDLDDTTGDDDFETIYQKSEDSYVGTNAQDPDLTLCRCEGGVELALGYAKMWCRYAKDLLTWMDKRISLEQEFAKSIMRAADAAKSCIAQQDMMPLQQIYTLAMDHDLRNSTTAKHTAELLQQRCYQALSAKKNEIDKWRREFKEQWSKEQKRMHDAVSALKRARQQYVQRCEELEKAKAMTAKAEEETGGNKTLDKRRKSRDDAKSKVTEAEMLYRQCVCDANYHQEELEKVKQRIIVHMRKLICQGDTVLKEATVNMFYFQRQQTESVPLGYLNLEVACRPCEAGEPYMLYISGKSLSGQPLQNFIFQEFIPPGKRSPPTGRRKPSSAPSFQDSYALPDDLKHSSSLADGRRPGHSDSDSKGGSSESLSSPAHGNRKPPKASSTGTMSSDDLDEKDAVPEAESEEPVADSNGTLGKPRTASRAALTHRLRKMKSKMVKCKQCDNYILVNGIECEECGLAVHRKCLEVCQMECEHRRGFIFGMEFALLPRESPDAVPFVVLRCTEEIESRALTVQGVYRISGSKPRILKLCQAFEIQKDQVDLSDLSPHDITSVLKHFFKELPEPLLTFDLYNDFIYMGKEIQRLSEKEHVAETAGIVESIICKLRDLTGRLPQCNLYTVQHMMAHLNKVAEHYEDNKMSPGNLGIIFGPTLLRPLVSGDVSMVALLETSYQALLVEFMISHYDKIFGPATRSSTPPPPAPTAPLPETPPRASCSLPSSSQDPGASSKERPRSLENRTLKRDSSEGYISDKSSSNEAMDQLSPEANARAVLAMRATASPRGHLELSAENHLQTQSRAHFSRQPVKYYRQGSSDVQSHTTRSLSVEEENAASRKGLLLGSADSSRSSSPEPQSPVKPICRLHSSETLGLQKKTGYSPENQTAPHGGVKRTESDEVVNVGQIDTKNTNQSNNNNQGSRERQLLFRSLRRRPTEQRSAQKVLSGLKLRRSDSGKGEQLHFV